MYQRQGRQSGMSAGVGGLFGHAGESAAAHQEEFNAAIREWSANVRRRREANAARQALEGHHGTSGLHG